MSSYLSLYMISSSYIFNYLTSLLGLVKDSNTLPQHFLTHGTETLTLNKKFLKEKPVQLKTKITSVFHKGTGNKHLIFFPLNKLIYFSSVKEFDLSFRPSNI